MTDFDEILVAIRIKAWEMTRAIISHPNQTKLYEGIGSG
jgi:hypothetical protein